MVRSHKFILGLILVLGVYFLLKGMLFLDPDYGWHLTMGNYILAHGIPATDPFSYTMPSYPFVDHEWLSNVVIVKGVATIGYNGVALVYALLTLGALFFSLGTLEKKAFRFSLIPFFLSGMTLYSFAGVRPQVVTWFCFALLLWIVRKEIHFLRFRWLIPFLLLFWVNLHGGFALGMATLILASCYWYKKKKVSAASLLTLIFLTLVATIVTPYGYRMWWEVWMQMSDTSLHFTIQEWLPAIFSLDLTMWLFVAVSLLLVGRSIKKFSLLDQVLYGLLLIAGLSSIRQMPLWILIALPITTEAIGYFSQEVAKISQGEKRFFLMGKLLFVMVCLCCLPSLWTIGLGLGLIKSEDGNVYPDQGIRYLKQHIPKGQVFSTYDWGGYLIWKLPEKKVFIDGRMPSWRWHANLPHESNYAFQDYRNFVDAKVPFGRIVSKYHITTLFLPKPVDPRQDAFVNTMMTIGEKVFHLPLRKEEGFTLFVKEAKKAGWVVVYQDDAVVIYQNTKEKQ